jgi:hypothetical protein
MFRISQDNRLDADGIAQKAPANNRRNTGITSRLGYLYIFTGCGGDAINERENSNCTEAAPWERVDTDPEMSCIR